MVTFDLWPLTLTLTLTFDLDLDLELWPWPFTFDLDLTSKFSLVVDFHTKLERLRPLFFVARTAKPLFWGKSRCKLAKVSIFRQNSIFCGVYGKIWKIVLIYLVKCEGFFEGFVEKLTSKCADEEVLMGGLGGMVRPPAEILRFIFHLFFCFVKLV